MNLFEFGGSNPAANIDGWGLKALSLIVAAHGVPTTFDFGYDLTIHMGRANHPKTGPLDLLMLWRKIKRDVGKYDPSGKCGNCLKRLTLKAHGITDYRAAHGSSRYIDIAEGFGGLSIYKGPQTPPVGTPAHQMYGKTQLGAFANNHFTGTAPLTAGTATFFRMVKSVECKGGADIKFLGCNTGTGRAGRAMLGSIKAITGGRVTGPDTSINMLFGFPVVDLNRSGSLSVPMCTAQGLVVRDTDGNYVEYPP